MEHSSLAVDCIFCLIAAFGCCLRAQAKRGRDSAVVLAVHVALTRRCSGTSAGVLIAVGELALLASVDMVSRRWQESKSERDRDGPRRRRAEMSEMQVLQMQAHE